MKNTQLGPLHTGVQMLCLFVRTLHGRELMCLILLIAGDA